MKNQGDNLKYTNDANFNSTQADELHLAIEQLRKMGRVNPEKLNSINYEKERQFWI